MLSIRDPVHGFVRADPLETALINSRPVQRLRFIHQLGFTFLVFPGAEHSRFGHVIGAMHLAGRVYDALCTKSGGMLTGGAAAPERRLTRVAALLHDLGHAPFSHSAEDLFEGGIDHEEMTRRLLGSPEIEEIFARHGDGLRTGDVRRLLQGGGTATERLLDTMLPIRDPETGEWGVGVDEGGVHALEALVMARYYMFTQVYFNVTGKAMELHLNEWLEERGVRWSAEPEAFLGQDDVSVWSALRTSDSVHAHALVERRHFPVAFETREHLSREEKERFEALLPEVRARFGLGSLLVSNSAKDPHRMSRSRVLVRRFDGSLEAMEHASQFIRHLSRIDRYRVYTPPPLRDEVASALREQWTEALAHSSD